MLEMNLRELRKATGKTQVELSEVAQISQAELSKAFALALGRPPSRAELEDSVRFVVEQAASYRKQGQADPTVGALADFCQVLLGLNEFVYVD